jgi:hypothetical protein
LQQVDGTLGFQWDFLATRKGGTRVRTAVVVSNLHVGLQGEGSLGFQWDSLATRIGDIRVPVKLFCNKEM